MKRFALSAAVFVLSYAVLAADSVPSDWTQSELVVTGVADIDLQGKVEHLDLLPIENNDSKVLETQLAPLARSTMSQWDFVPATLNGKPARARTSLYGVFEFRTRGSNHEARLVFIGDGPRIDKRTAIAYPGFMYTTQVQATLIMLAQVQADGSLSDIHLESARSTSRKPVATFVYVATKAMSSWHAEPETVDGHAVKTWVRIPIAFGIRASDGRQYDPQLERSVDSPAESLKTSYANQSLALDSPVKMLSQSP